MAMNFKEGRWNHEINVTDFVKTNITPYEGDASFLAGPTERTKAVWNKCLEALAEQRSTLARSFYSFYYHIFCSWIY